MINIILHNLVHRLPYRMVLLLQILQLLLQVDVVLRRLGLLLVPHGGGGGGRCGGRCRCGCCLPAGLRGPLRERLVPVLADDLSHSVDDQGEDDDVYRPW